MTSNRIILTMKWGTLYSADYVNVLCNALRTASTEPLQCICLTDDPSGIQSDIICHPIPDIGLGPREYAYGAWPKLGVFCRDLYGLSGRALFVDLDTVVVGGVDDLFNHPGALVCINIRPWRYKSGKPSTGTGIFAFDIGAQSGLVDVFQKDIEGHFQTHGIEQEFIHATHGNISYWPDGWVASFKYHQRRPLIADRFLGPRPPAPPTKILAFHGRPRPIDLIRPKPGNWDVFPHYGRGAVPWMVDYWTRNGGKL